MFISKKINQSFKTLMESLVIQRQSDKESGLYPEVVHPMGM